MRSLHIDIETYCTVDLKKAGAYRYAEEVELLLFGYKYDDELTQCVDVAQGEQIPQRVLSDLTDPKVKKKAFNAAFEISQLESILEINLPVDQWECTAARTAMCGLPLNLEQAVAVLNLDHQKDKSGYALIRYFCIPCKPTKTNGFRTRNLPEHDREKWQQFIAYCKKDVEAEWALSRKLSFYQISEFEHQQWCLDMKINKRGVAINVPFVKNAIKLIHDYEERLTEEARQITSLSNPKSVAQLKKWLLEQPEIEENDIEIDKLTKDAIPEILKSVDGEAIKRVLEIRQESSKTSTKKYPRMLECLCSDGRVRGVHQYYGANRTGRNAHRLIQTGNFPRGRFKNIEPIRDLVMLNDADWLEYCYGAIPDIMSSLLRSALVPSPGKRFIISDFSSVESGVLAWLAGEEWVLEVFRTHGKIYEMTASKMFGVPIEEITKTSPLRQKGKISTLLLGFQGGAGALIRGGALKEGLTEEELPAIVSGWRIANPNIVNFWYALQKAAILAITTGQRIYIKDIEIRGEYCPPDHGIYFELYGKSLFFGLPSGRQLVYVNVAIEEGDFGERITYWGVDQTKKKWCKLDTWGGKLAENCLIYQTKVLSLEGWIELGTVTPDTLLWDGYDWVFSSGVIAKGIQQTISVNGVRMTADHKILTTYGWKEASSCEGFNRFPVEPPHCNRLSRKRWKKITLESKMRLRNRKGIRQQRYSKGCNKILWLYAQNVNRKRYSYSRSYQTSSLLGMAVYAGSVSPTHASSLAQLRRTRYTGVRKMENFYQLLERHESNLQTQVNFRENRCERKLRTGKLYVGNNEKTNAKQTRKPLHKYSVGANHGRRSLRTIRDTVEYNILSDSEQLARTSFTVNPGFNEPVFDIVNCGPKNQFVVQDENGFPFIVHNCTQAVARDLLMHGMQNLDKAGYDIVLHVHDEAVCEMPIGIGSLEEVNRLMCTLPSWAIGLPLKAAGEESFYYKK